MKKIGKALLFLLGGFMVLMFLLGALAGAFENDEKVAQPSETVVASEATETTIETPVEEVKQSVIGDKLQVGDVVFTVNERSRATNVGGEYGVNSKGEFLILDVSVENLGNEAITVDSSYFKLLSNGKTFEADSSAGIYANEDADFFYESINPDLTMTGKVVFDISTAMHEEELVVQVQTGIFGTETGEIALR